MLSHIPLLNNRISLSRALIRIEMVLEKIAEFFADYWLLFVTFGFVFVYQTCIKNWSFFSRNGVPFVRGLPVLGSMWTMFCYRDSMASCFHHMYQRFPNDRFFGMYELFGQPTYVIRDPELAKKITVKDFDHFVNHRTQVSTDCDPLLGRSMVVARDEHWRKLRSIISPAFTGSKMRLMLSLVGETAQRFVKQLESDLAGRRRVINVLDVARHYSSDTIASAAFGLDVNSLANPDCEFFKMGIDVSDFSGLQSLKFLGYTSFPSLMKLFKIGFFNEKQIKYFRDLTHDTIVNREKLGIVRHDMINLLIEAKKGKLFHKLDDENDADIGFATVQESNIGKSNAVFHGK